MRQGDNSGATLSTRSSRSRKTASIGNRIKAVWMEDAGRSSIPSDEERPLRPRRPRRRVRAVSARRQLSQTTCPSSFASAT